MSKTGDERIRRLEARGEARTREEAKMESKHTHSKTPFTVAEGYEDRANVLDADGFVIAEVSNTAILHRYAEKLGVGHWADLPGQAYRDLSEGEMQANGALFAAAPDMAHALRAMLCYPDAEAQDLARAALAKATGETP